MNPLITYGALGWFMLGILVGCIGETLAEATLILLDATFGNLYRGIRKWWAKPLHPLREGYEWRHARRRRQFQTHLAQINLYTAGIESAFNPCWREQLGVTSENFRKLGVALTDANPGEEVEVKL